MSETAPSFDIDSCLQQIESACEQGQLTASSVENLRNWLTQSRYTEYRDGIIEHINEAKWKELDDVFWTVIPFGTGGRRGRMYPFGSNAINDRTIGESAQGLAEYVKKTKPDGPWSIGIAYDTRHRSREFAELCAGIMVANGFTVYFIDDYRSTPELSFLIRYKQCDCGIMVTASHNPPSDNAVKVYWSSGAQLIPPHDKAVIERVNEVDNIEVADFQQAVADGKVIFCREETDAALMQEHLKHSFDGPRDLKIIYSPLHGVGEFNVKSLLNEVGFHDLEIYERHREPSGDFPNVPGNVSNPENAEVFTEIIAHGQQTGAGLIMASDPDCDRMGAAAPLTTDPAGPWSTFNGNQLCALLGDFVCSQRQAAGNLTGENYFVTTLVTTQMLNRIADEYGIKCFNENLVGFKWICSVVDEKGPDNFIYGAEESHGYLVGQYCRDKDGAVACMLMAELAAHVQAQGKSLHQHLDELYMKYGFHHERLVTIRMEGADGMTRMQRLMDKFRSEPPATIGGMNVSVLRDYLNHERILANGSREGLDGPTGNLVIIETDQPGNYVAARPSGTEPKVKFYMFTYMPPADISSIEESRNAMTDRLDAFAADMQKYADSV
ncbi:MAG: phospho-sugar mutase [Planctomycetota bacterium]